MPRAAAKATPSGDSEDPVTDGVREKADFHHTQAHAHLRAAHGMAGSNGKRAKHHLNQAAEHINKLHGMATGDNYSSTPPDETGEEYGRG
jgi:hypothetical protein